MSESTSGLTEQAFRERFFRLLLVGRVVTCLAILSVIGVIEVTIGTSAQVSPIAILLAVLILLTIPYVLFAWAYVHLVREVALVVLIVDTLLLTLGEYLLGGENALYGLPLYGILIVMSAVIHSRSAAYGIAALGAGSYAAMVGAVESGRLPHREALIVYSVSETWGLGSVTNNFFLSFAMATVATSLSKVKDDALRRSRNAERQLATLNELLESRVDDAVLAQRGANEELRRRNEDLAKALRQVNIFASAVSHDLRNPVTAASEALRLSKEGGPELGERLRCLAQENLMRVDRMVVGLRDIMVAFGRERPVFRIPVEPLVREVLRELDAERMIDSLPVAVVSSLGEVVADREALAHVFRNLIANALDHNGGVANLRVSVGRGTRDGIGCYFVRDNGRGVPKDAQEKIFRPFHRGPEPGAEGLGLGLALVNAIVSHVGGVLWVESEADRGATFWFSWPVAEQEHSDADHRRRVV